MRLSQFVPAAAMAATHFMNAPRGGTTCWSAACNGGWASKNQMTGFAIDYCDEFWNSPSGQKTDGYASAISVGTWDDVDSCVSSFLTAVNKCYNSGIGVSVAGTDVQVDISWTSCVNI